VLAKMGWPAQGVVRPPPRAKTLEQIFYFIFLPWGGRTTPVAHGGGLATLKGQRVKKKGGGLGGFGP
jgi:hypothetical protein